jgi:hypothetical protein
MIYSYIEFRTLDKVHKPRGSECRTPLSKHFSLRKLVQYFLEPELISTNNFLYDIKFKPTEKCRLLGCYAVRLL